MKFLRFPFRRFSYKTIKCGKDISKSFKLYIGYCDFIKLFYAARLEKDSKLISPFHDIPLRDDINKNIFNMVVEIPKFTNAKMEISKNNKLNPIMYDLKDGLVRNIKNLFPYHGYIWNYGALPQTWENPFKVNDITNIPGDNDPLDAIEIGRNIFETGSVIQVKIIGVLGMIDQGEMDWKLITINTKDPQFEQLRGLSDIESLMPGLLNATKRWFQYYKVPDGKSQTEFAFNGQFKDEDFSLQIIGETHEAWESLIKGVIKTDILCSNTTISDSPFLITKEDYHQIIDKENTFEESDVKEKDGKWYFV